MDEIKLSDDPKTGYAKGGFGTTFKAVWKDGPWNINYGNKQLERNGETKVALKCLHNSQDITAGFLKEVESNILACESNSSTVDYLIRCFGITKDPKTNNFMMRKLWSLRSIAVGLEVIHKKGLIHHDFYCGNILSDFVEYSFITDLGLCQPANVKPSQNSNKKIYGVLPYVAPEVLRGNEYTQKIHDEILAMKICKWLRPKSNYKIPQLILDIINQCWDADPLKRPKADELGNLFTRLWSYCDKSDSLISEQAKEADEINKKSSSTVQSPLSSTSTLSYITHPQAVYTSRLLNFKNLPEPKNSNNDDLEYSDSLRMSFTKLDINSKDKSS
ncbi:uncharacterized protein OCT59_004580 [Rhizophagus irregularis]|uniref:uncharacterized protein n=1 Tax=Rhizophagus irregularis TaxID=588596 RepID=UPI00332558F7|nr:hypothetical protein OCT59_004580 [Rhizophagus irregularis]